MQKLLSKQHFTVHRWSQLNPKITVLNYTATVATYTNVWGDASTHITAALAHPVSQLHSVNWDTPEDWRPHRKSGLELLPEIVTQTAEAAAALYISKK